MKRFVLSFLICIFAASAFGDTIYVDANGTGDYPTIQAAINAAANGDVIILMPGTYTGDGNRNIAYLGKAIMVRSTNPCEQSIIDSTIIDCEDAETSGIRFANGEGPDSVLSGLTITRCYGSLYCDSSGPTISNCRFINNNVFYGGSITSENGSMIITNCTFIGSTAMMTSGCGISNLSGNMEVSNCVFRNNHGAGIINIDFGVINITNCIFSDNESRGLDNLLYSGIANVNDCTFSGHSQGIFNYDSSTNITVTNCILWNNSSQLDGPGFTVSYSCIQGGFPGTGNIDSNPLFVTGPDGDYYLSQIAAGQAVNSPCVDSGSDTAANLNMDSYTTRTDEVNDTGIVDMGYHYGGPGLHIFQVFPSNLEFIGDRSVGNPASQTIVIKNLGGKPINWTASVDTNWLSIDPNSGVCPAFNDTNIVTVDVNITGLNAGMHYASIVVSAPYALNSPQIVFVQLRVIGPVIGLSQDEFYFEADEGEDNPAGQVLGIQNIGLETLNWEISETCDWLSVDPACGSSTSEVDEVNIIIDAAGLTKGIHTCEIIVSSDDAENSPQIVTVELRVYGPVIKLSGDEFYFEAERDANNPADQVLGIQNIGGGTLNWQASNLCSWLNTDPNCGSSTSEADEVNIIVDTSGLTGGIYICELTVFSDYAENSPQVVTVELTVTPVTENPNAKIYWTDSGTGKIQRANLDGSNIEDLITGLSEPSGIALDQTSNKMYWTEAGTGKIQRANLDGNDIEDLITAGLSEPRGIALDTANGKMYWTNYGIDKIQRANLDGTDIEDLITTGIDEPYGISLDTLNGKMYWTENDAGYKIQRANLDGSNIEELVNIEDFTSLFIDLDIFSGKMYWVNSSYYRIRRANLDGSNIEILYGDIGMEAPWDIALDPPMQKMYWTNYGSGKICRANLDGSSVEELVTGLSRPEGIAIQNIVTDDLKVTPCDGLESEGIEGGPFIPSSKIYTLTNIGPNSLDWTASVTQDWIDVSPSTGTLGPNEVNTLQISINSNAIGLDFGTYNDLLTVTDLTNGIVQNRSIKLEIDIFEFKLIASDGAGSDNFGESVDICGNRCIVGTPNDDSDRGSAYIFEWNGTGWIQQAKLLASDGAIGDEFGYSVSISGDHCIVGTPDDDDMGSSSGSAYIFEFNDTNWIQQAKLTPSDSAFGDYFGTSVKIEGNRCVVGASQSGMPPTGNGKAYIFEFNGTNWIEKEKLTASDGFEGDAFGCSGSIDGDRCIVGACYAAYGQSASVGSAYIFEWNGTSWIQKAKLMDSVSEGVHHFGSSVDIDDNRCIVRAIQELEMLGSSLAYIFEFNGTNWIGQKILTISDSGFYGDRRSVGIYDNRCVVGSFDSAYIFQWDGSIWKQGRLTASDGASCDSFGYSVSICNGRYIVGAPGDDDNGSQSGSVYVYQHHLSSDLDKNMVVDFNDFIVLASQWLQEPGLPPADIAPPGGDGFVDYDDLASFCQGWLD